jgi:hypothetical protein
MRRPLILFGALVVVVAAVVALSGVNPGATATPSASSSAAAVSPAAQPTTLWPAPSDPLERAVAAGLQPAVTEHLATHVHAHLDVFIDGTEVVVPAGIGINVEDPEVKEFQDPFGYGGIKTCAQPCISPLHTHDETGILHTESLESTPNTLGEFFTEWGVELSDTCVADRCDPTSIAVYIDGAPYDGDPRAIELIDRRVIVVVIGTPPAQIPKTADFSNA